MCERAPLLKSPYPQGEDRSSSIARKLPRRPRPCHSTRSLVIEIFRDLQTWRLNILSGSGSNTPMTSMGGRSAISLSQLFLELWNVKQLCLWMLWKGVVADRRLAQHFGWPKRVHNTSGKLEVMTVSHWELSIGLDIEVDPLSNLQALILPLMIYIFLHAVMSLL